MDIMLLHDSHNEFYRTPSGPAPAGSNVLIRLHCDEATSVVLRTWMTEELCYTMLPTAEHVWEVAIPLPTTPGLFWYYFLIYRKDGRTIRYGNQPDKLGGVGVAYDHGEPESFQITLYDPAYKTPNAFHGANIYQIFPDRFRHAPTKAVDDRKDRYVHQNWDEELLGVGDLRGGKYQELDFYGGTLTGIQEKLPYLKDMGIDIIYLNPIFRARSNHRYDTGDYTQVDPLCGTNTEFTELCEAAKKVGIRVMLDGVFSHTGVHFLFLLPQLKHISHDGDPAAVARCGAVRRGAVFEFPVAYETFEFADGDRFALDAQNAGAFALRFLRADAAADRRQRTVFGDDVGRLLQLAPVQGSDKVRDADIDRAGRYAAGILALQAAGSLLRSHFRGITQRGYHLDHQTVFLPIAEQIRHIKGIFQIHIPAQP